MTVASDDEHPDAVDELNSSEATVDVRWIDIAVASICVADARWLEYTVDARNVDAGLPVTFTWYPDADGDLVAAKKSTVAVQAVQAAEPIPAMVDYVSITRPDIRYQVNREPGDYQPGRIDVQV